MARPIVTVSSRATRRGLNSLPACQLLRQLVLGSGDVSLLCCRFSSHTLPPSTEQHASLNEASKLEPCCHVLFVQAERTTATAATCLVAPTASK